jgi:hypothetical protein
MSTYTMTKKSLVAASLVVLSVVAGGSRVARADDDGGRGFVELAIGEMTPMGDDQWDNVNDSAFKIGLHGGAWARHGLGFELAVDYTPLNSDYASFGVGNIQTDLTRLRLQIGGRGGAPIAHNLRAFGRFLVGADYVRGSVSGNVLGVNFDGDDSDVGLAVEIGGGVLYSLGIVSVGAQLAIPMAFHFTEQDAQNENYLDFDYNAYDVDLLLTVGTAF